ncbi:MAG: Lrp/AsnC family transcriptional regulator [Pseudomonadota bacterium]
MTQNRLDRIDVQILATLQDAGNITNVRLAERVGLSSSPCLQRVKRLEQGGYIARYSAVLNLHAITEHVVVFTEITLADHDRAAFARFERAMTGHDNVAECYLLSGGFDYLVKFVARSVSHYHGLMEALLDSGVGIDTYFSYIAIKPVVEHQGVALHGLMPSDRA